MNEEDNKKQKAIELSNRRMLDENIWSEYPAVDNAVVYLFHELKKITALKGGFRINSLHIKILILNLLDVYLLDPAMYLSLYRRVGEYKAKNNRYNKSRISKKIIDVVDKLVDVGFIIQHKGAYDREGKRQSYITRIRATDDLIQILKGEYRITGEMIGLISSTESVILRDYDENKKRQVNIQYEDTERTHHMREDLCAYNNLLHSIYIDIPDLEDSRIETSDGQYVRITQQDKFVRRIFSNGNFEEGGRYYGGWWQRIPSSWREKIEIAGSKTGEIDYSGLHIVILYAIEGIDYWSVVNRDPYKLDGYEQTDRMRGLLKKVLLVAINSKDKETAIRAVRQAINEGQESYGWFDETGYKIGDVIDSFAESHAPIKHHFFSGAGIKLQNIDSLIAEYVIQEFTNRDAIILCVHDSFIVNTKNIEILKKAMDVGYRKVINEIGIEPKTIQVDGVGMNVNWYEPISRRSYGMADWIDMHLNIPFMEGDRWLKATIFKYKTSNNYYIINT